MALSLKNLSIAIILVGLIFIAFSLMLNEGAANYGLAIDNGTQESFNVVNQSVIEEYNRAQNYSKEIYRITGSEILEGAFEGGSAIVQIIRAPFDGIGLAYKIMNQFADFLRIPKAIMVFFESMLLVSFAWLMIYSIRRYREDR